MTVYQWLIFLLAVQVIHFLGTWKLYTIAGRKSWEAAIPVYNAIVLMKIINRPTWWTILLFIPIINLILFPVVWVETLRSFGKNSTSDTWLGILTCGLYIYYINYTQKVSYITDRSTTATTKVGDTISSILFAIVVATVVHTYFIQPFTIPTASLEKSLLVGDFLFVSKYNYGARVPMTTVAAPMVHDTLPLIHVKSYSNWPQLPYFRFPGYEKIKNNDIVVFNWPVDTVVKFFDKSNTHVIKPIDKKSNYVKRCVGIPGDSLSIKNGLVYINNKELILPERSKPQFFYTITTKNPIDQSLLETYSIAEFMRVYTIETKLWENKVVQDFLLKESVLMTKIGTIDSITEVAGYLPTDIQLKLKMNVVENKVNINLTQEKVEKIKQDTNTIALTKFNVAPDKSIFPHTQNWSCDNFGPIYIPQEGKTVQLNTTSLPFYKRIITEYEGNTLSVQNGTITINGKPTSTYTFKQDYYWMMGDNRHNSEDSRYWGYVPANHVVGKPIFIWMSIDGINGPIKNWKIRWDRLFTTVSGEGQPQSYFKFFLIALALYFGLDYFYKKRKLNKQAN